MAKIKTLEEKDRKAELTLLVQMEELSSVEEKKEFADLVGIPWEEYLRLCRKYSRVLERYRRSK